MERNQRLVLVAGILGSFVAFLDMAVVNVALPAIRNDLGGGFSSQQWMVDAYLLTLGSMILVAGSLSDLFGRKRIFTVGLIGFAATSLLCAFARSAPFLIASRGLQGAAGALLVPSSLALIIANFSGPAQGKAIGTWTAWTGIAFVVGPLLGGALVDAGSWRAVFAINVVPVVATLLVLSRADRDPARGRAGGQVDAAGAALCAAGLGGIIFALIEAPGRGWADPVVVVTLGAGVGAFVAFVVREHVAPHPMLDLGLFGSRNFAVGNVATVLIYAGLSAATFLITLFLQQVARYSAVRAGLALVPVTAMMFVLSPVFGRLSGRLGPRWFMALGPAMAAAGFALMTRLDARGDYLGGLLPGVLVFGIGLSSTVAPLTAATLGDIDPAQAGIGSAANNAIARVAGLLAVAGLGVVLSARFSDAIDQHVARHPVAGAAASFLEDARRRPLETSIPKPLAAEEAILRPILDDASVRAFHAALWAIAGLLLAGGTISAVGIKNPGNPGGVRTPAAHRGGGGSPISTP